MIFKALGRILMVGFALILSVMIGFFLLTYLSGNLLNEELVQRYGTDLNGSELENTVLSITGVLAFLVSLYPAMTIFPALLVVVIGEIGHIRSLLYYVLAGGAGALSIPLLYVVMSGEDVTMPSKSFLTIFATSGFVSGLVYWLLAGRRA